MLSFASTLTLASKFEIASSNFLLVTSSSFNLLYLLILKFLFSIIIISFCAIMSSTFVFKLERARLYFLSSSFSFNLYDVKNSTIFLYYSFYSHLWEDSLLSASFNRCFINADYSFTRMFSCLISSILELYCLINSDYLRFSIYYFASSSLDFALYLFSYSSSNNIFIYSLIFSYLKVSTEYYAFCLCVLYSS